MSSGGNNLFKVVTCECVSEGFKQGKGTRIDVEIVELKLNNSKIRVYVIFSVHSRSHDV